jgi:ATP-dependent helicase/nuclease subunit B
MSAVLEDRTRGSAVRSTAMPIEVVPVTYGPDASRALHAAVVAAKAGDPLAPVTVVVPTNYVGVAARRLLGSGALGRVTESGEGVAGVTFLTMFRLAELLGAARLTAEHRRPVSTPVLAAAVRGVLAEAPGRFRPVAGHPATEAALVEAHRELSALDDAALDALVRTGPRAADVVRISRRVRSALAAGSTSAT